MNRISFCIHRRGKHRFDRFGNKQNSVWFQVDGKILNKIRFSFIPPKKGFISPEFVEAIASAKCAYLLYCLFTMTSVEKRLQITNCINRIVLRTVVRDLGRFTPWTFHPRMVHPRTFHPRMVHPRMVHPRTFYPRMIHPPDCSPPGMFAPRIFHPTDCSPP